MTRGIRPKDVAREYMHRFVHYIPDIGQYQQFCKNALNGGTWANSARYAVMSGDGMWDATVDRFTLEGANLASYHDIDGGLLIQEKPENLLAWQSGGSTDWRQNTLMVCPRVALEGAIKGVYCFDTFAIDDTHGDHDSIYYAHYRFTARWNLLTDLRALTA
jgi:hypothetical protein